MLSDLAVQRSGRRFMIGCVIGLLVVSACNQEPPPDAASQRTAVDEAAPQVTSARPLDPDELAKRMDWDSLDQVVQSVIRDAMAQVQSQRESAESWGQLGRLLLAHDRFLEAAECFENAARLDPSKELWAYLAGMAWKPVNAAAALDAFSLASRGNGRMQIAARLERAGLLMDQGRLDQAEDLLREVLVVDSGNPQAHEGLARIALWEGRATECLQSLRSQLGAGSVSREFLLLGAEAARRMGAPEISERYRQLAMKTPPTTPRDPWLDDVHSLRTGLTTRLKQADQLFLENRIEESISLLQETLGEYPDSEWARVLLARAFIRARRLSEAEITLQETLDLNPNSFEATFRMGVAKMLAGDEAAAGDWFRKSIALKPSSGVAYKNLASCLARQGKWHDAADALQQSVVVQPNYFEGYVSLVEFHLGRGNLNQARAALESARQLHPNAPELQALEDRLGRR